MGYEIDFLPVGDSNGDAIVIRYGEPNAYWLHVVDGGYADTGEEMIKHIERWYGRVQIANVVLSHADDDHATGLISVLEHFDVHTLWMNRPWLYAAELIEAFHGNYTVEGLVQKMKEMHPYLVEMEDIAARKGIIVREVFQGAAIGQFRVLAPSRQRYIRLIPGLDRTPESYATDRSLAGTVIQAVRSVVDAVRESMDVETLDANPPATSASNETSVVQLAMIDNRTILLTADVGPAGLNEAADYAASLGILQPPSIVQIPHHGSRRNVTPAVLDRWLGPKNGGLRRGSACVSVGRDADIYPRKKVKNAFMRRGYAVFATRGGGQTYNSVFPMRSGYSTSMAEPFSEDVED